MNQDNRNLAVVTVLGITFVSLYLLVQNQNYNWTSDWSSASVLDHESALRPHVNTTTRFSNTIVRAITFGEPRTATTVQFNIVCVSLFLQVLNHQPHLGKNTLCLYAGKEDLDRLLSLNSTKTPHVLKTHRIPPSELPKDTWLFSTARNKTQAFEKTEEMKRTYMSNHIGYVQDLETLSEFGIEGMVKVYASIFGLSSYQTNMMIEYFEIWDTLRICCGVQMSQYWRNQLLPNDKKNWTLKEHPFCSTLDIDTTEMHFIDTELYKILNQYKNMIPLNRPALMDGPLNGTYCSRYNEAVRKWGLGFNEHLNKTKH